MNPKQAEDIAQAVEAILAEKMSEFSRSQQRESEGLRRF